MIWLAEAYDRLGQENVQRYLVKFRNIDWNRFWKIGCNSIEVLNF